MPVEKHVEQTFRRKLKSLRCVCLKLSPEGTRGYPDRLILLPGGTVLFVELKRPGGVTSKMQKLRIARLIELGYDVLVTSNAQEAYEWVKEREEGILE